MQSKGLWTCLSIGFIRDKLMYMILLYQVVENYEVLGFQFIDKLVSLYQMVVPIRCFVLFLFSHHTPMEFNNFTKLIHEYFVNN